MISNPRSYFIGVLWFLLSIISSVINDAISKYLGCSLPCIEVSFLRFLFSTLSLIPFIIYFGRDSLKSSLPQIHIIRGTILFFGISAWTYGLSVSPISTATVMSFTIPIFTLILANIFLKENIIWQRWLATIIGFVGIYIVIGIGESSILEGSLIFVLAAIGFAFLDVINKKYIVQETMISMLFYSALVTTILAFIPAYKVWVTPCRSELILFFILGASANLILFFILKAFKYADASALAPYRYLELLISGSAGYLIFDEKMGYNTIYGAMIIIPSTLFIIYSENKKITQQKTSKQ